MASEIERKWVTTPQWIDSAFKNNELLSCFKIYQRYFHNDGELQNDVVARVRTYYTIDNQSNICNFIKAELTTKTGSGLVRSEHNVNITKDLANSILMPGILLNIEKHRYTFINENETIEVDVYCGDNHGLIHVEVEFASIEDANAFVPPTWFGTEVTNDIRHTNASLQTHPYIMWNT